jgi:uncharacterized repeat protein (TIGR03847 family)
MAEPDFLYDLRPVRYITADAVGMPGQRTFYLQAEGAGRLVTLLVEKDQVRLLSESIEDLLAKLVEQGIAAPRSDEEPDPSELSLRKPLDPLFRVGQLGLGYDADDGYVVMVARELQLEEEPEEEEDELLANSGLKPESEEPEPNWVRFWTTLAQAKALSKQGARAVAGGRPLCPQCLQPMEASGHFCPKKNGHHGATHE